MKNISNKRVWIGLLVLAVVGIIAVISSSTNASPSTDASNTLTIGAAFALTGDGATWGEASRNAAQLAVDEINTAGGVNGQPINLIVEDMKSTSHDAVLAVSKLQDVDHADALLTTWLDVYQGPLGVIRPDMLVISPDAGVEAFNVPTYHPNIFSMWYRTGVKSELDIKTAASLGYKRMYIIGQNDPYYIGVMGFVREYAKKYGIEIVGEDVLNSDIDIQSVLLRVAAAKPDSVFFGLYDEKQYIDFVKKRDIYLNDVAVFADEFVSQNYQRPEFGADSFEGIYFHSPAQPDQKFWNAYKTAYGTEPVFGAAATYDSVYMIVQAYEKQPENMVEYVRSHTFDSVTFGTMTFDSIGGVQAENSFVMQQIVNGVPTEVRLQN